MSFSNVGKVWSNKEFNDYIKTIAPPNWIKAICLHHTAAPSLAQRPNGLLIKHIENIRDYYIDVKKWSTGPHFFVDENQIFGMTPVDEFGIHAASFNRYSLGIEVLGNYDKENPKKERGLQCWQTAALLTRSLFQWLKIPITSKTLLFHRDDPKTDKTCPGKLIDKPWVLDLIKNTNEEHFSVYGAVNVSVAEYFVKKGVSREEVYSKLKTKNWLFFYDDIWLESAYYDKEHETTMASLEELEKLNIPT